MSRLPRPGPAADPIDDSFPDDATSGNPGDYVGPQGSVLDGVLLRDLEPLKEGVVDPGGGGEKRVVLARNTVDPRPPKPLPLKPRRPAAPSLLGAIVDSVPQVFRNAAPPRPPEDEATRGQQILTLPSHERARRTGSGRTRGGETIVSGTHAVGSAAAAPRPRWSFGAPTVQDGVTVDRDDREASDYGARGVPAGTRGPSGSWSPLHEAGGAAAQ